MEKEKKLKKVLTGTFYGVVLVLLIINLVFLANMIILQDTLVQYQAYFFDKTENLDHAAREQVCLDHGLDYIQSLQESKDLIQCCQLAEEDGTIHIDFCEYQVVQ